MRAGIESLAVPCVADSSATIHHRLLNEQPNVHHAVHLAAVRKMCETNPNKILRAWKQRRSASHGGARTAARVSNHSSSGGGGGGGGVQGAGGAADEAFLTAFDNLESLAEDGPPPETQGGPTGKGGWFFGGQSKAAKFRAD